MAFTTRHENDRFDHSKCAKCGRVFAGVASFDAHRPCGTGRSTIDFININGLLVLPSKATAYRAMLDKAATARAGKK